MFPVQMSGRVLFVCAGRCSCVPKIFAGRVGEWLKPADCKSAAPCGLRRFESSPVHQRLVGAERNESPVRASEDVQRTSNEITEAKHPGRCFGRKRNLGASGRPVRAWVAQLVERVLGKDEVTGSIPVPGSRNCNTQLDGVGREKVLESLGGGNSTV